jgi:hypothetical protein
MQVRQGNSHHVTAGGECEPGAIAKQLFDAAVFENLTYAI